MLAQLLHGIRDAILWLYAAVRERTCELDDERKSVNVRCTRQPAELGCVTDAKHRREHHGAAYTLDAAIITNIRGLSVKHVAASKLYDRSCKRITLPNYFGLIY